MPFTPFHLGPALFFGLLLFRFLYLPSFFVASIIIDIEPFLVLAFGLNYPLHGFFHSFIGGSVVAFILSLVMLRLRNPISRITSFFNLEQRPTAKKIIFTSLAGVYLHILLDSIIYDDINPLYPLDLNPFRSMFVGFDMYMFCTFLFFAGLTLYLYRLVKVRVNS